MTPIPSPFLSMETTTPIYIYDENIVNAINAGTELQTSMYMELQAVKGEMYRMQQQMYDYSVFIALAIAILITFTVIGVIKHD